MTTPEPTGRIWPVIRRDSAPARNGAAAMAMATLAPFGGERQRGGAADAGASAGDEGGLGGEAGHGRYPLGRFTTILAHGSRRDYRPNSRVIASIPSGVSGNIRPSINCRVIAIDCV